MDLDKRYRYEQPISENQLRILVVKPGTDLSAEIECTLLTDKRETCSPYTALSYCWGTVVGRRVVWIDGFAFEVSASLASALQYMRLEKENQRLWVDQICINQDDLKEKKLQVTKMARTYEESDKTVVWLGDPDPTKLTSVGMRAIDELGSQLDDVPLAKLKETKIVPPANVQGYSFEEYGPAILHLMTSPWFTRLWVVQEICLAPRNTTLVCGKDEVAFWKLTNLLIHPFLFELAMTYRGKVPSPYLMLANVQEPPIGLTRQYFVAERKGIADPVNANCSLLSNLWNFRNRKCEKPVDRIYALLGISRDIVDIEPDYDKEVAHVFTKATHAIIEKHGKLDVLSMSQGPDVETDPEKRRPSWVPHFGLDLSLRPFSSLTIYTKNDPYFSASGQSHACPRFSKDLAIMQLSGYLIDEIESLAYDGKVPDFKAALDRSWGLAEGQASKPGCPYTGIDGASDIYGAFWRTLITNRSRWKEPAQKEPEGVEFETWWKCLFKGPETPEDHSGQSFVSFHSAWIQHHTARNYFTTKIGYMGLCPWHTVVGDIICLFPGAQVPLVIRQIADKYQLVGECYLHDVMDGTLWSKLEKPAHEGPKKTKCDFMIV